jgi:hypothetical protein
LLKIYFKQEPVMSRAFRTDRRTVLSSMILLGAAGAAAGPVLAQTGASALNLAMVAEPPTLDIQSTPADLVCIIMQHVYEPLYTFDAKSALVPMLAESMPKISADGKTLRDRAAQGREAAQRARAQRRRRGGQPEALDGRVAARQVGGGPGGRPRRQRPG